MLPLISENIILMKVFLHPRICPIAICLIRYWEEKYFDLFHSLFLLNFEIHQVWLQTKRKQTTTKQLLRNTSKDILWSLRRQTTELYLVRHSFIDSHLFTSWASVTLFNFSLSQSLLYNNKSFHSSYVYFKQWMVNTLVPITSLSSVGSLSISWCMFFLKCQFLYQDNILSSPVKL